MGRAFEVFRARIAPRLAQLGALLQKRGLSGPLRNAAFNPPRLVWFTVPVNRIDHVAAEGLSGKRSEVPPSFLQPYSKLALDLAP